jgi:formylglycine-generating enzyme required for sulfatase activity
MKTKSIFKKLLLLLLMLPLCGFYTKEDTKKGVPSIDNFNQRFVAIDKNLYADKYAVTVSDYQFFLREMKEAGVDYSLLTYDSTQWQFEFLVARANLSEQEHYFNHTAYANYPVVCISYHAANEFCKWLTEKYNVNPKKQYKKVVFRLPIEVEYKKAAISHYDLATIHYPWGNNSLYSQDQRLCNFLVFNQEDLGFNTNGKLEYKGGMYHNEIEPVWVYQPNPYGLYNMVGNVSEMVLEEGVAGGGDWMSPGYDVGINSKKKYDKTSCTVGFRVYMEIIEF